MFWFFSLNELFISTYTLIWIKGKNTLNNKTFLGKTKLSIWPKIKYSQLSSQKECLFCIRDVNLASRLKICYLCSTAAQITWSWLKNWSTECKNQMLMSCLLTLRPKQCSASFIWHDLSDINWETKAKDRKLMHGYMQASGLYILNGSIWILFICEHLPIFFSFFFCLVREGSFRLITCLSYDSTTLTYFYS